MCIPWGVWVVERVLFVPAVVVAQRTVMSQAHGSEVVHVVGSPCVYWDDVVCRVGWLITSGVAAHGVRGEESCSVGFIGAVVSSGSFPIVRRSSWCVELAFASAGYC